MSDDDDDNGDFGDFLGSAVEVANEFAPTIRNGLKGLKIATSTAKDISSIGRDLGLFRQNRTKKAAVASRGLSKKAPKVGTQKHAQELVDAFENIFVALSIIAERFQQFHLVKLDGLRAAQAHLAAAFSKTSLGLCKAYEGVTPALKSAIVIGCSFLSILIPQLQDFDKEESLPRDVILGIARASLIGQELEETFSGIYTTACERVAEACARLGFSKVGQPLFPTFPSLSSGLPWASKEKDYRNKVKDAYKLMGKYFDKYYFPQPKLTENFSEFTGYQYGYHVAPKIVKHNPKGMRTLDPTTLKQPYLDAQANGGPDFGGFVAWLLLGAPGTVRGCATIFYQEREVEVLKWVGNNPGYILLFGDEDFIISTESKKWTSEVNKVFKSLAIITQPKVKPEVPPAPPPPPPMDIAQIRGPSTVPAKNVEKPAVISGQKAPPTKGTKQKKPLASKGKKSKGNELDEMTNPPERVAGYSIQTVPGTQQSLPMTMRQVPLALSTGQYSGAATKNYNPKNRNANVMSQQQQPPMPLQYISQTPAPQIKQFHMPSAQHLQSQQAPLPTQLPYMSHPQMQHDTMSQPDSPTSSGPQLYQIGGLASNLASKSFSGPNPMQQLYYRQNSNPVDVATPFALPSAVTPPPSPFIQHPPIPQQHGQQQLSIDHKWPMQSISPPRATQEHPHMQQPLLIQQQAPIHQQQIQQQPPIQLPTPVQQQSPMQQQAFIQQQPSMQQQSPIHQQRPISLMSPLQSAMQQQILTQQQRPMSPDQVLGQQQAHLPPLQAAIDQMYSASPQPPQPTQTSGHQPLLEQVPIHGPSQRHGYVQGQQPPLSAGIPMNSTIIRKPVGFAAEGTGHG